MASDRSHLKVVHVLGPGKFPDERIALSLVHSRSRIDIPVSVIRGIDALGKDDFRANVEIGFTPAVSAKLYELTSQIVGQPLKIVIDGRTICEPIVREPLGRQGRIWISVFGLDKAHALAERLRERWSKINLRLVPRKSR
jgi:hypothetical protein